MSIRGVAVPVFLGPASHDTRAAWRDRSRRAMALSAGPSGCLAGPVSRSRSFRCGWPAPRRSGWTASWLTPAARPVAVWRQRTGSARPPRGELAAPYRRQFSGDRAGAARLGEYFYQEPLTENMDLQRRAVTRVYREASHSCFPGSSPCGRIRPHVGPPRSRPRLGFTPVSGGSSVSWSRWRRPW